MDYEYSKKITEDPVYVEGVKDEAIRLMGDLTQVNKNVEELSAEMEGWE